MAGQGKDTMFCTPAFGLFGTMIDLGVDLAPVRSRIQECKLKYHRELWKIICERGMSGSDQWTKRGSGDDGGGSGEDGDGGGGGGEEAPPDEGSEGGAEGGGEDVGEDGGEDGGEGGGEEVNQNSLMTWRNHSSNMFLHSGPPGGPTSGVVGVPGVGGGVVGGIVGPGGVHGRTDGRSFRTGAAQSSLRYGADKRSAAAVAAALAAATAAAAAAAATSGAATGIMTSAVDSTAAASILLHQQNLQRYNGAQLANSGRRAAQLSFSRAKAQLPNTTPTPSSTCTSSNDTSHHRSTGPPRHNGNGGADAPTFVPMHCGNWGEPRASKKSSSKRQKHSAKEHHHHNQQPQALSLLPHKASQTSKG